MHSTTLSCVNEAEVMAPQKPSKIKNLVANTICFQKLSKLISVSSKQWDESYKKFTRLCSHLVLLQDIQNEVETITVAIGIYVFCDKELDALCM